MDDVLLRTPPIRVGGLILASSGTGGVMDPRATTQPKARVLVVEDEALVLWSIAEWLTRDHYDVVTAVNGASAIEKLAATRPALMLLDLRLPDMDGLTVLRRALDMNPQLVVVMISAHGTVELAVDAMKQGAVDFLVKPFEFELLETRLARALEISKLRHHVADHKPTEDTGDILGTSSATEELRSTIALVGDSDVTTALIQGESGVGKELVARAIHARSRRRRVAFLEVNCAAVPDQLLESELYGHERGAFTDAHARKHGLFERAAGGTVLLDEIGDMSAGGQAKLLHLLENRSFRRVGGTEEIHADIRLLAATNVNLADRVAEGKFRLDLLFRLNVIRIDVLPLRERTDDIPVLASHFVSRFNRDREREVTGISYEAMDLLMAHRWPGNVRELRNVIERALVLHPGIVEIRPEHLPRDLRGGTQTLSEPPRAEPSPFIDPRLRPEGLSSLEAMEHKLILDALEKCNKNQSLAARMLGITRDTLRYRMKKHGLAGPSHE